MRRHRNLRGADVIDRAFKRMPREGAELVADAINKGAQEIEEYAQILAPLGDTGELKADIHSEIVKGKRGVVGLVTAGTRPDTASKARAQEFGRRPGPDGHPGHVAQEYMFPAYFARRKRVIGRIRRALAKAARLAFSRTGGPS